MGIFLKDTATFDFESDSTEWSFPSKLNHVEYMTKPHSSTGHHSGAYLLASFLEAVTFQLKDPVIFTDTQIVDIIYNPSKNNISKYITLKNGMETICDYIHDTLNLKNISSKNIIWFNSIELCKRYIHRNNYIIVEMQCDSYLLNYSNHLQGSKFDINVQSSSISSKYTKGFICCGYDSTGFILFNSLGDRYGSNGFVRVSNNVFIKNFIKGATINNIFG